jgi:hypothetical protein
MTEGEWGPQARANMQVGGGVTKNPAMLRVPRRASVAVPVVE